MAICFSAEGAACPAGAEAAAGADAVDDVGKVASVSAGATAWAFCCSADGGCGPDRPAAGAPPVRAVIARDCAGDPCASASARAGAAGAAFSACA
ncbi:MAG TPA: hypothetical protein VMF68_04900, partial [Spirochaetia bacterium]|nr:hypothetical protein [Spirochaetia bacterium]